MGHFLAEWIIQFVSLKIAIVSPKIANLSLKIARKYHRKLQISLKIARKYHRKLQGSITENCKRNPS
jgi:hypothetical protein